MVSLSITISPFKRFIKAILTTKSGKNIKKIMKYFSLFYQDNITIFLHPLSIFGKQSLNKGAFCYPTTSIENFNNKMI